ncbi:riboflavin synthase [Flavobacteriaceae bacterium]|jgi:riboflavin synthase|nr:riboflavin synthase [Flavobacteriaceae bacterium]MDA9338084.1 riboflavin synthase [Flavobacteriaceae bacterium]MDB4192476.1 riboflavin synthase [Flavobacteriaceae bacterium]MDB4251729.1 riboflavin synthase [Flavobacteriaceae bacterium]MDB9927800.1 riboflavin synthase [Flavobacteriaceae bacterium]|tara:strand:+ start:4670 stop:5260 length:591 start_codon:yes stop_codon:yes gene_type:complete
MFTGIIETLGRVEKIEKDRENINLTIQTNITDELKIDQSIAHNGVCLTVVAISGKNYVVTAIKETLDKTNLGHLSENDLLNIERAMKLGDRLDGHIVQGHVDQTAVCSEVLENDGSWIFTFVYDANANNITIEKGSVTVNGVSLTVVDSKKNQFSVAIIPYTYTHTGFSKFKKGTIVNLEFDVIGKYVARLHELKS